MSLFFFFMLYTLNTLYMYITTYDAIMSSTLQKLAIFQSLILGISLECGTTHTLIFIFTIHMRRLF